MDTQRVAAKRHQPREITRKGSQGTWQLEIVTGIEAWETVNNTTSVE